MTDNKHIIIYSHGSGVRYDDRGLLTSIADALPGIESILFDYYKIDEDAKTLTLCPFSEQVKKLHEVINDARLKNPEAVIDLIGHSQGTTIIALAKPKGIRKIILLAPVFNTSVESFIERYKSKPLAVINLKGISYLPPVDGLSRIIPSTCWPERNAFNSLKEYNSLSKLSEIIMIEAKQDNILKKADLSGLSSEIKVVSLDGDHNFNAEAREPLIKEIIKIII